MVSNEVYEQIKQLIRSFNSYQFTNKHREGLISAVELYQAAYNRGVADSSLRKGAEELDAALLESTSMRHSTGEYYSVEVFFMSLDSAERFRALLSARCARIRSALVSGSREEPNHE